MSAPVQEAGTKGELKLGLPVRCRGRRLSESDTAEKADNEGREPGSRTWVLRRAQQVPSDLCK